MAGAGAGDNFPEIDLNAITNDSSIRAEVAELERRQPSVVSLRARLATLDRARSMACALRAVNISSLILLTREEGSPEVDTVSIFGLLHDWDQMLLQNFLEFCGDQVPPNAVPSLRIEAKLELKWFTEWLTAASDQRIYKYPGLPWRSYVRKVNAENFQFATKFLDLMSQPHTPERDHQINDLLKTFLIAKKKVLCIFPKNWGKN